MKTNDLQQSINYLYSTLQDSRNGYQECAKQINDQVLKAKFQDLASDRQTMLDEIRKEVSYLGTTADASGSVTGAAHRIFVDLKSLVTGGDKDAIIKEIERGEGFLKATYNDVLNESIPDTLRQILQGQLAKISNDLANIKSFYSS